VDEISAYAKTARCRHGHLNAYLGGRAIERCGACDNCVEIPLPADAGLPDEREQFLTILRCVSGAPWSWGRVTLVRILRGEDKARAGRGPLREGARDHVGFGALAFRSKVAVERMVGCLEGIGLLQARRLEHGGVVLDLTPAGQAALRDPSPLDDLLGAAEKLPPQRKPSQKDDEEADFDEALFEALRAWRLEQARLQSVPPYVVFHDSHLRTIAAHQPATLEALSELKGIGPRKLEQYGGAVLELVREHLEGETS
jgi:ATP-dependent DNA helicase RecQ